MKEKEKAYLYETYVAPKITTKNGVKSIDEEYLQSISFDKSLSKYIRQRLEKEKVVIYSITEKDRSPKVKESDYGDVETYSLEAEDKPKMSTIEYADGQVVSEDYEELISYLDTLFIPKYLNYAKGKLTIPLHTLTRLKLSDKELQKVFELLKERGITVRGTSQNFEEEENYDYLSNYHSTEASIPAALSSPESTRLVKEYQLETDEDKKHELQTEVVEGCTRLVRYVVGRVMHYDNDILLEYDDLVQIGYEALLKSMDRFDPSLDYKFSTYAYSQIKYAVYNAYRDQSILSANKYEQVREAEKAIKEYYKQFGKEPTPEDIAKILGKDPDHVRVLFDLIDMYRTDMEVYRDYVDTSDDVDQIVMGHIFNEMLREAMSNLSEREQLVLKYRFGFIDGKPRTLEETGRIFNVTRERIRQMEAKALRKLRHPRYTKKLKNLLDIRNQAGGELPLREYIHDVYDEDDYSGKYTKADMDYQGNDEEVIDPLEDDYAEFGFTSPKRK